MPRASANYEYAKLFADEIWRFYIDYYRQLTKEGKQKGSLLFDVEEPGYMAAMLKAHQLLNNNLHKTLTPHLILQLYRTALEGVSKTNLEEFDRFDRFRSNDVSGFWLKLNTTGGDEANVSREGLREFLQEVIANGNENKFEILSNSSVDVLKEALAQYEKKEDKKQALEEVLDFLEDKIKNTKCKFVSPSMTHKVIEEKIKSYLLQYEEKRKHVSGDQKKLDVIIELVQKIERLHPFIDGNCRTLVMLVLNKELIRNGFKPTMLWNPNRFDFFATEQLRQDIIDGWMLTKKYQSEIANLNTYKTVYEYADKLYAAAHKSVFHKDETTKKAERLEKLLQDLKAKSPHEGIELIQTNLRTFKSSRGLTTRIFGLDTTTENLLRTLMNDLENMPSTSITIDKNT
ncbi:MULTISPECIES: Fic family protein [unclassified Legionella]|uniref:Fic family protein n=1 Tax=unclassified Legionella TaxID=2622702 RepID=UPI003AF5153C